jgi:hypothetical protein
MPCLEYKNIMAARVEGDRGFFAGRRWRNILVYSCTWINDEQPIFPLQLTLNYQLFLLLFNASSFDSVLVVIQFDIS